MGNIYIWPSYCEKMARVPIFGHAFFGHHSAIFGLIGLTFFMGAQETIIYRLMMRNTSYGAYLEGSAPFMPTGRTI